MGAVSTSARGIWGSGGAHWGLRGCSSRYSRRTRTRKATSTPTSTWDVFFRVTFRCECSRREGDFMSRPSTCSRVFVMPRIGAAVLLGASIQCCSLLPTAPIGLLVVAPAAIMSLEMGLDMITGGAYRPGVLPGRDPAGPKVERRTQSTVLQPEAEPPTPFRVSHFSLFCPVSHTPLTPMQPAQAHAAPAVAAGAAPARAPPPRPALRSTVMYSPFAV